MIQKPAISAHAAYSDLKSLKDSGGHPSSMSDKEMLYIEKLFECLWDQWAWLPIKSFIPVYNPNGGNQKRWRMRSGGRESLSLDPVLKPNARGNDGEKAPT